MKGKLRIKTGIGKTQVSETLKPLSKHVRGKSAIGLGNFSKYTDKSQSPSKGVKKLNVNVNVNVNNGNR